MSHFIDDEIPLKELEAIWRSLSPDISIGTDLHEYISVDANLATSATVVDDDIVGEIINSNVMEIDSASDDDCVNENIESQSNTIIKHKEAQSALETVRTYLSHFPNNEDELHSLQSIENRMNLLKIVSSKQSTIDEFYKKL